MQSTRSHARLAGPALLAAAVLLAGCGSSHRSSSPSPPSPSASLCPSGAKACISTSPKAKAIGPPALAANLIGLMAKSDPTLKRIKLNCEKRTAYPILCEMTATNTNAGKTVAVAGTVRVLGVATSTRTYAYAVDYAPTHR